MSITNKVGNLKQTPKVAQIIKILPIVQLDWSTECSGCVFCSTRCKNIHIFCDFNKDNYESYEFMNGEWIKFSMYNMLLTEA